MGLFSCISRNSINNLSPPRNTAGFEKLLEISYEYLSQQQDICKEKYGLSFYEHWYYDQSTGIIEFSDSGIVKLRIRYEEVGSVSTVTDTWLWAWANPHLLDPVKREIVAVKEFGEKNGLKKLTKPKWYADEYDGWEMTTISAYVMQAKGAYRIPSDSLFSFLIFKEVEDLRKQ